MNKKYLIGICIVLLIIIAVFAIWKLAKHPQTGSQTSSVHRISPLPKEVTVSLDKNGFTPATVTINVGSAVRWENESGSQQTVNSDNYPTNQLHKELNFGVFNNGSSVVYTFTKPGIYGYHNQINPKQKGKIIVK